MGARRGAGQLRRMAAGVLLAQCRPCCLRAKFGSQWGGCFAYEAFRLSSWCARMKN